MSSRCRVSDEHQLTMDKSINWKMAKYTHDALRVVG
jgi:hypothetical protein